MILTLKNTTNIKLEWSYLVLEYLEEREGSLDALQKQVNSMDKVGQIRLCNSFVYAVIQACVDDVLTYKQAIRLVRPEDYPKIFGYIQKQLELQESYKQKKTSKKNGNHPRGNQKK